MTKKYLNVIHQKYSQDDIFGNKNDIILDYIDYNINCWFYPKYKL